EIDARILKLPEARSGHSVERDRCRNHSASDNVARLITARAHVDVAVQVERVPVERPVDILTGGQRALTKLIVAKSRREREGVLHAIGLPCLLARRRLIEQFIRPSGPSTVSSADFRLIAGSDVQRSIKL